MTNLVQGNSMFQTASLLILTVIFCIVETASENKNGEMEQSSMAEAKIVVGQSHRLYEFETNQNLEYIFHFYLNRDLHKNVSIGGGIRIETATGNESLLNTPVFFNVKRQTKTLSWILPSIVGRPGGGGVITRNARRTLCENSPMGEEDDHVIHINVYTSSPINATFSLQLIVEIDTNLVLGKTYTTEISHMSPQVFKYVFPDNNPEFLQLKVESEDFTCMTVSIQNCSCPIQDQESTVQFSGYWQTMTRKAGMTISANAIRGARGYYVVFVVHEDDSRCQNNMIGLVRERGKTVKFSFTKTKDPVEYLWAILGTIFSLIVFSLTFFLLNHHIQRKSLKPHFMTVTPPDTAVRADTEQSELKCAGIGVEGAAQVVKEPLVSWTKGKKKSVRITLPHRGSDASTTKVTLEGKDVFTIDVAEHDEEIAQSIKKGSFRFRFSIGGEMHSVSQLAQKDDGERSKEIRGFVWGLVTVGVFYSLPVIQLALLYLRLYHSTGNQDLCYYNYLCARPWWRFQDFNHVFSNIGYITLGLLFIILTYRNSRRHLQARLHRKDAELYGIPRHFGLFYALGGGLVAEGVLSASYHVCPTRENIQFDMCFMYVTGILCFLKMYQTRHQDISATSHVFYAGLAFVAFISLMATIIQSDIFWIPFTIFYLLMSFAANLRVYYVRQLKLRYTKFAKDSFRRAFQENVRSHFVKDSRGRWRPRRITRIVVMILSVFLNLTIAIYSYHARANVGFNLLAGFMANFLLYIGFYIVMKKLHSEKILLEPSVYGVCVLVLCTSALFTYVQETISWALTPAESRSLNKECILLGFYDSHDVWHFLSAGGVFFSFMLLLTLDNDVETVPRSELPVF